MTAKVSSNDQVILEQFVKEAKSLRSSTLSDAVFFEEYATEQALRQHDLSYDELEHGHSGGGGDGGLDYVFTFLNGKLVMDDTTADDIRSTLVIEVVLVQAKFVTGFQEDALGK